MAESGDLLQEAVAMMNRGDLINAELKLRALLQRSPDHSVAASTLGVLFAQTQRVESAVQLTAATVKRRPDSFQLQVNYGFALRAAGRYRAAIETYEAALKLNPNHGVLLGNIGTLAKEIGHIGQAIAYYRRAITAQPSAPLHQSNYLFTLHFDPDHTPEQVTSEHRIWGQKAVAGVSSRGQRAVYQAREPGSRIRIGFVSPDFADHPVSFFLRPLFEHIDRNKFDVIAYADVQVRDEFTAWFKTRATEWRETGGMSDQTVVDLVRQDRIDLLFDLAGHTARNRQGVFACRPAPVLAGYLGYPNSSGLPTIDYRVTDPHADPVGMTENLHVEPLLRLPETAWCYAAPNVQVAPERKEGPITFGSFNQLAKISVLLLRLWARILRQLPAARFRVKAKVLNDPAVQDDFLMRFVQAGGDTAQVDLEGWTVSREDHFRRYHAVDIALDTYPYHGTTTTCDALWMGVPVITLAGRAHVSRVGASLLNNVGLPELIARTPDEYVELAVALASDAKRRRDLRCTLRSAMQRSPLMDGTRFVGHFEHALEEMTGAQGRSGATA